MTDAEKREAARQFHNKWVGKGKEDEDDRSYWIDFLQDVMGVDHVTDRIEFQKKVVGPDGNTKRIDAYIPETHVLIEQKSLNIDLSKPQPRHNNMTPYEQAKMYDNSLPVSEKAKWIILSNFAEIWVYDMDTRVPEPTKLTLDDIPSKYSLFDFLINQEQTKISQEMEISVKAGEFVGLIYDALLKQYINPENEESLKSLNMLCVRLVFCLYAEDAHIFGENGQMFHDYMEQFETKDMRKALIELFKILDTPEDKRDPYDTSDLSKFPYVNGGLFADESIEIPNFTEEIRNILLAKASEGFDWSMISPTIFGAVFESTLNPETRRSGGMHYTSIENIHKVIDPLFLDDLKAELDVIKSIQVLKTRNAKLKTYQNKLASLTWLDPACGSGNFLTETYISIRRLENDVISTLKGGQISFATDIESSPIKVGINQFYGIEINDFAVTVAKTALWVAESQMLKETEDIILMHIDFLPLKTNAFIIEGNALRIDWENILPASQLNYIMGNPPFLGYSMQNESQKKDILEIYVDEKGKTYKTAGKIDYVSGWYFKAAKYIYGTGIKAAFVSTNSITQGEQVASVWKPLYDRFNVNIIFAYKTFIWDSEASQKAHVHCVIVGFSSKKVENPKLYEENAYEKVQNISPYLVSAPNIFIESRNKPLCSVLPMSTGNRPADGGNLIIEEDEYDEFIKKEPKAVKYIKKLTGAVEYINNKKRYCLWLVGADPSEIRAMPEVMSRIEKCKNDRLNGAADRQKLAATPTIFRETKNPESYIIVPRVSSQNRRYIPIGFLDSKTIPTDSATIIEGAREYEFGVLTSNVHMAWMRTVAGRLKSDYRYSKDIVYNNFPWPSSTEEQKAKIEQTARGILDARALYPNSSLADLYDPLTMPPELQKAHIANDKAVMQAYGFSIKDTSEADCVAALMKMYQELTAEKEK